MSDSVRPQRWQPTRLPHPWDSPGKNTGAGCHFLLQCMKVKSESEVAQSCPSLSDPMDCSPPDSSVHGISQARILEYLVTGCHFLLQGWQRIIFNKYSILSPTFLCYVGEGHVDTWVNWRLLRGDIALLQAEAVGWPFPLPVLVTVIV